MKNDISHLESHMGMQKKEWIVERTFWVIFFLFLLAAVLGLFGSGMFSKKKVAIGDSFTFEYEKFLRHATPEEFYLKVNNYDKAFTVALTNVYTKDVKIKQIIPEPQSVELKEGYLIYHFKPIKEGMITFYIDPFGYGNQDVEIIINENKKKINQFIYF